MRFITLLFSTTVVLLVFAALSPSTAIACGENKVCCTEKKTQDCENTPLKNSNDKQTCGGTCNDNTCHCPQVLLNLITDLPTEQVQVLPWRLILEKQSKADWYFLNKIPAAVYLSIWLPPKI